MPPHPPPKQNQASMDTPKGENMDAGNLYGVMTIMATFMLAPFALLVEGSQFNTLWMAAKAAGHTKATLVKGAVLSGMAFYLYKWVSENHPTVVLVLRAVSWCEVVWHRVVHM